MVDGCQSSDGGNDEDGDQLVMPSSEQRGNNGLVGAASSSVLTSERFGQMLQAFREELKESLDLVMKQTV